MMDPVVGQSIGAAIGQIGGAMRERAQRRFEERQGALDLVNEYKKGIAEQMTFDPANLLRQALQGQKTKALYGHTDPIWGSSLASRMGPETEKLIAAIGDPASYNLMAQEGGGYQFKPWDFSPVVSEKYKKHLGGYVEGGQTKQLGQGQTTRMFGGG